MNEYCIKYDQNYYGYVYLTLDQKHNKVYVGQRKGRVEDSKNYFGSGLVIRRIIKSRGDNFLKKKILGVCDTKEELLECETECKKFFNALNPLYGYNILEKDTFGDILSNHPNKKEICKKISNSNKGKRKGIKQTKEHIEKRVKARSGYKHSEKTRKILSEVQLNIKRKPHSKETKEKISKSHLGKKRKPFSNEAKNNMSKAHLNKIRKPFSNETKKKMSLSKVNIYNGKNNPSAKKYLIFSPEGKIHYLYGEFKKFCKENNLNETNLRNVAKGILSDYRGWKCISLNV